MVLNAEEKMRQAEYEKNRRHFSRLTLDQKKLKKTKHERDKLKEQLEAIRSHMTLYDSHQRAEGVTLDNIRAVLK